MNNFFIFLITTMQSESSSIQEWQYLTKFPDSSVLLIDHSASYCICYIKSLISSSILMFITLTAQYYSVMLDFTLYTFPCVPSPINFLIQQQKNKFKKNSKLKEMGLIIRISWVLVFFIIKNNFRLNYIFYCKIFFKACIAKDFIVFICLLQIFCYILLDIWFLTCTRLITINYIGNRRVYANFLRFRWFINLIVQK